MKGSFNPRGVATHRLRIIELVEVEGEGVQLDTESKFLVLMLLQHSGAGCSFVSGDFSFIPSCLDLNNHTETTSITTLLGLLAQVLY